MIHYRKTCYSPNTRKNKSSKKPEGPDLFSICKDSFHQTGPLNGEFLKQKQTNNTDVSVNSISTLLNTKNTLMNSINSFTDTYSISKVAKKLNLPYGRTTLYQVLREKEILNFQNIPNQKYRELGYFKLYEKFRPNNAIQSDTVLLVTGSGLAFIKRLLNSDLKQNLILKPESL